MGILDRTLVDLEALTSRFTTWLTRHDRAALVHGLRPNAGGAGYSNTTYFASVELTEGPVELVVRVEPADPERALFPSYDIAREFRVMRALAEHTDVPVPHCRWLETDPTVFGKPFLVMDRVPGEIPTDSPSYLVAGMVVDADDEQRARMWTGSVELLATLARVDWRAAGLGFLRADAAGAGSNRHDGHGDRHGGGPGAAGLAAELDRYEHCYRWGRQGSPAFPEVERALRWLRAHRPEPVDPAPAWGDARLPNFVYSDHRPVCLIDWETATLCAPEYDLAWFLLRQFDREQQLSRSTGVSVSGARPGGFASDAETIARYEEILGRPVRDLRYHWALNAFKTIAIKQRHYDLQQRAGLLAGEQAEAARTAGGPMLDELLAVVDDLPAHMR